MSINHTEKEVIKCKKKTLKNFKKASSELKKNSAVKHCLSKQYIITNNMSCHTFENSFENKSF